MHLRKVSKVALAAVTGVAMASGAISTAVAAPAPLDPATQQLVNTIIDRQTALGVPVATQQSLVSKFLSRQSLDADANSNELSSSTSTVGNNLVTRHVYADGSVAQQVAELPQAATPGRTISGCRTETDADIHRFFGCTVKWDAATWSMDYRISYDYFQFGANITALSGQHYSGGGSLSDGALQLIVAHSGGYRNTAEGEGRVVQRITIQGVGVTRTVGINFQVNSSWIAPKAREKAFGS